MLAFVLFEEEMSPLGYFKNYISNGVGRKYIEKDGKYYSKPEFSPNGTPYEITADMLQQYRDRHPLQTKFQNISAFLGGALGGYGVGKVDKNIIKYIAGDNQIFQNYPNTSDIALTAGLGIPMGVGIYKFKMSLNDVMDRNKIVDERMKNNIK